MKARNVAQQVISNAISEILNNGERRGLTKPYDLAVTILTDLDNADLQLIWQRGRSPKTRVQRLGNPNIKGKPGSWKY